MSHLPPNDGVNGLDLLVSLMEEKLWWKILWWLNRNEVQGGDAELPADPGRFDLPRPVYSWGMYSFRNVRSPR